MKIKENNNIIDRSIEWANKKGLLNQGINPEIDIGFIFEECLEMLGHDHDKCNFEGLNLAFMLNKKENKTFNTEEASELLDGCGDLIIYSINFMGKILKEKGIPDENISSEVENILNIIMNYNEMKNTKTDKNGKLTKTKDFEKKFKKFYPQKLIKNLLKKYIFKE